MQRAYRACMSLHRALAAKVYLSCLGAIDWFLGRLAHLPRADRSQLASRWIADYQAPQTLQAQQKLAKCGRQLSGDFCAGKAAGAGQAPAYCAAA